MALPKYIQEKYSRLKSMPFLDWLSFFILLYVFIFLLTRLFSYIEDIGGAEYAFLYIVQLADKPDYLYGNPDAFPFFVTMYPPIFPYLLNALFNLFGINLSTDIHQALVAGRMLSFLLWIFDLYLLKKITQKYFTSDYLKLFPLLLFTLLLSIHFFALRPDSYKITLFLLFFFFALKNNFTIISHKNIGLALVFAIIAVFFKHDIAIYISLYFGVNFLFYKKKETIIYFSIFIFLIVLGFFSCSKIFGAYFIRNIFIYNIQYAPDLTPNLSFILLSVLKTLPLIIITVLNFKSADKKVRFIAALGCIYFLVSNLTLFRVGADLNYTYESAILLVINYSIYFSTIKRARFFISLSILLYLLLFNKYLFDTAKISTYNRSKERNMYDEKVSNSKEIRKITGNDVVFFTLGRYMIFNTQANLIYGYDLHMERSMELTYRYPLKTTMYSNKSVLKYDTLYANGFVKYIVTENDDVAHEQMKKYYKNYYFYKQEGNLLLYKFKTL